MNLNAISSLIIILVLCLCCTRKSSLNDFDRYGPPTMIYKIKEDSYKTLVPVMLSADKSEIIAYPSKHDLYKNNEYTYPTALIKGYYLDNRGISAQTAFLKLSYEMYLKMEDGFTVKIYFPKLRIKTRLLNFIIAEADLSLRTK